MIDKSIVQTGRRHILGMGMACAAGLAGVLGSGRAQAAETAEPSAIHVFGHSDAPVTIQEFFSYTCVHCAHFTETTFPRLKESLINSGKVKWVFRDFPLDGLSLIVAALARELPPSHYLAFQEMMLKQQEAWAVPAQGTPLMALKTFTALSGIPTARFDAMVADTNDQARKAVVEERIWAASIIGIDSTPSFILSRSGKPGFEKRTNMSADNFEKWVTSA